MVMNKLKERLFQAIIYSNFTLQPIKRYCANRWGMHIEKGSYIFTGNHFVGPRFSMQSGSFINNDGFIDCKNADITVGKNVSIGMGAMLITSTHELGDATDRAGYPESLPITIGDGCWLGARVTILPGVSIAPGCVIAAGSVVTTNTEENGLYAGVPAHMVKKLN